MSAGKHIDYFQKLKDPRWFAFRNDFITASTGSSEIAGCSDCGEDTHGPLHVHHRLYRDGAEPWEYDFAELRLVCESCHERIHETEKRLRVLTLAVSPHICYEINQLLDELSQMDENLLKVALARCKNTARGLRHADANTRHLKSMAELEQDYRREKRGIL